MIISRLTAVSKKYVLGVFLLLINPVSNTHADEKGDKTDERFQTSLASELPIAGSLNIDDEPLFGLELKYFLLHSNPHHVFLSGGFLTDQDKAGASVEIFNLDIGSQYDLPMLWGKRTYLEYSLGAAYISEEYSFDLIDREASNSFSESGFKASLGYGFEFTKSFGSEISLSQYSNDSRTLGISLFYSF